ncbi:MAG: (d)CMP kinase [Calditrichaeota bacterium]|nr:MAG: (d)CMP kinase [Calditrichota bacterium]
MKASRNRKIKIAIDGPAASGKSTTAQMVARKLGYLYIDSGAMYRAVTLKALQEGIPLDDEERVARLAEALKFEFRPGEEAPHLFVNGEDVSHLIRTPEVTRNIRPVAANPRVREILVARQRQLGEQGGVVMDGRDITTVVFPDAELKIYMQASPEARARRRVEELRRRGIEADYEEVLEEILQRDRDDQSRSHGPLTIAPDAVIVDTSQLTIDEQVDMIYRLALEKIHQAG